MAFFFRNKQSKTDLVKRTKDLLVRLEQPPHLNKTLDEISKALAELKLVLQGTYGVQNILLLTETDSSPDAVHQVVKDMIAENFFILLIRNLHRLQFEARKDSQTVLSAAFRFRPASCLEEETPAVTYVLDRHPETIRALCQGYEHRESAMPCGGVLRELLKNEHVATCVLCDEGIGEEPCISVSDMDVHQRQSGRGIFWQFFAFIENSSFEASTDAFTTFRDLLTKHRDQVPAYLAINCDLFFEKYTSILMKSESYVTKRQSIKLLGEILLDRTNYDVMTRFVEKGDHLKQCMVLLKDDRKMVQYESFHVFKVFVANPQKSDAVVRILTQNRDRLLKFLATFLEDRQDDDQFLDEKSFLIRQMQNLPGTEAAPCA